jgi:hypothetical protein
MADNLVKAWPLSRVCRAELLVRKQRECTVMLRRNGHDTELAQSLLKTFEALLAVLRETG